MPTLRPEPRRRAPWGGRGLTPQLFLFAILPLTALSLLIAFGSLTLHSDAMRALVANREGRAASAAAEAISQQFDLRATVVHALGVYAARAPDPQQALHDFAYIHDSFDGGLALVAPDGQILAATAPTTSWPRAALEALRLQADHQGSPAFSEPFTDPTSGQTLLLVASRAQDGPLAVGAFSPARLATHLLSEPFGPGEVRAWLTDGAGDVLLALGAADPVELVGRAGAAEALAGRSGVLFESEGGEEFVVAYHPIAPVGWALVIAEPWESADNPLLRQTQAAPLVLIPALLFALVAVVFGVRQIVQPLQALERRAVDLGRGRFESIEEPVGGIDEIKSLQRTLVEMARQLRASRDSIRRYVGALTHAQEEERRRLARELHDQMVQSLIALDQRSQIALRAVGRGDPDAVERLKEVRALTASLLEELRRVIHGLRPIYLEDLGLLAALEILAGEAESVTGAQIRLQTTGLPVRLPPDREIAIFRIAQEALNNVGRHAGAGHVDVAVAFDDERLRLIIRDDGRGFDHPEGLADLATSGHYGLLGMHERAERIGAVLDLRSAPGAGTSVTLDVPLRGTEPMEGSPAG